MLRSSVMGILMQKDPEQLIRQCFAGEQDPMNPDSHMMAHAFGLWAVKDPSGALSWFDQKVAEGSMESRSLDGRNSVKLRFEGALIGALMKQGGEAASRRLEALPAKDRVEVLGGSVALGLPQDRRGDFARMVRQHVPAEQQASMLARPVTMMVFQGGYDQVTEYLGQIDATAGERLEIAKTAMSGRLMGPGGSVDTKLQEATDWLAQVAPEHVDAITGAALGKWYGPDPDQRFELVERLHEEGGGDALLVAFLDEAGVYQNREAARRLAAKIESAEDRERLLGRLEDFQSVRPEITESPSP
jgi:hypothetical protein